MSTEAAPATPPAAPPADPPKPAGPPPDLTDRRAARTAKLKAAEAAAAKAKDDAKPAPAPAPANDNGDKPKVEPPKDAAALKEDAHAAPSATPADTKDPSAPPAAPPAEAAHPAPVVDPDAISPAVLIRKKRELDRKEGELTKRLADIEAKQKERDEAIAKREAALKEVDPDLNLVREIKEARTKKDYVTAIKKALGDGVDYNDIMLAVASALPEPGADGKPTSPSAAVSTAAMSKEEIQKIADQIAEEKVKKTLEDQKKAEEETEARTLAEARSQYISSIHKLVDVEAQNLPHVSLLKQEELEKHVDAIVDIELKAGRDVPKEATIVRYIENALTIDAIPRECAKAFKANVTKYPLLSEPEFALGEDAIRKYCWATVRATGKVPSAEEILNVHEKHWAEKLKKLRPDPEPPKSPPPAPTITSDWKKSAGGEEPAPKGGTVSDRKAERMKRLREAEEASRAKV